MGLAFHPLTVVVHPTALFDPVGLPGLAYWYVLYPVHGLIFRGTVRVLAERALRRGGGPPAAT